MKESCFRTSHRNSIEKIREGQPSRRRNGLTSKKKKNPLFARRPLVATKTAYEVRNSCLKYKLDECGCCAF